MQSALAEFDALITSTINELRKVRREIEQGLAAGVADTYPAYMRQVGTHEGLDKAEDILTTLAREVYKEDDHA